MNEEEKQQRDTDTNIHNSILSLITVHSTVLTTWDAAIVKDRHDQEYVNAMLRATGAARYEHFIKLVANNHEVWGLYRDGWAALDVEPGEGDILALWPTRDFAELCATGIWSDWHARSIDLDYFLEHMAPAFRSSGCRVAVFFMPDGRSVLREIDPLIADLLHELEWYE